MEVSYLALTLQDQLTVTENVQLLWRRGIEKKKPNHNLDLCKHRFSYADCSTLYFQFIAIYEFSVFQPASNN